MRRGAVRNALKALAGEKPPHVPEKSIKPMFGCASYTPQTTCEHIHKQPIPRGSRLYCPVCHSSGFEPELARQRQIENAREKLRRNKPPKFRAKIKAAQQVSPN
jgi:hypothetical protein